MIELLMEDEIASFLERLAARIAESSHNNRTDWPMYLTEVVVEIADLFVDWFSFTTRCAIGIGAGVTLGRIDRGIIIVSNLLGSFEM
jgi:hypothetical protein